jgi:hypothetical protein
MSRHHRDLSHPEGAWSIREPSASAARVKSSRELDCIHGHRHMRSALPFNHHAYPAADDSCESTLRPDMTLAKHAGSAATAGGSTKGASSAASRCDTKAGQGDGLHKRAW